MTVAKLRIDLNQGIFEAEGSEDFLLSLYNDVKDRFTRTQVLQPNQKNAPTAPEIGEGGVATNRVAQLGGKAKKKGRPAPTIVKDLDLSKGKSGRLKDFYAKFEVKSNFDRNLVFVYFLQNELDMTGITVDHVFTCYRDVGAKLPNALRQSLLDTSNRNGWLDTSSMSDIRVATQGVNHLEHDMARKIGDA